MKIRDASDSKPGQEKQDVRSAEAVRHAGPARVLPRLSRARRDGPLGSSTAAAGRPMDAYEYVNERLAAWTVEDLSPRPLISGEDLISLGLKPGPSFTRILTAVEDEQLEDRLSDRESALAFVRDRFQ